MAKEEVLGKTPPQSIDTEKSILGALMLNPKAVIDVLDIIEPDSFYYPKHKKIFEAIYNLFNKNEVVDIITVTNQLNSSGDLESIGGREYLAELVGISPSSVNVQQYAKIIDEKCIRRKLIEAGNDVASKGMEEGEPIEDTIDESEKIIFNVTNKNNRDLYKSIKDEMPSMVGKIMDLITGTLKHKGIETGFKKLDDMLSGLQPSDLIILAARPGVGKTAFALDIARRSAIKHKTSVGIFSLEMSKSQLIERILASESKIHAWKMRTGKLNDSESMEKIKESADTLSKAPIYIDDRASLSTVNIRSTARRMKKEHDISLIIVDYLQLVYPHESKGSNSMVQQVTEISRTLKQIAKELDVPVLALSQLSREIEKRQGKPRLSDLRDSGSIEQDADIVMFLHKRPGYEGDDGSPETVDLLIEKHRNGPVGKVTLHFDKKHMTFLEENEFEYDEATLNSEHE